jgi:AraC family transcriptional regulator of adaptative response/methylated-DNA-[protein]-cysteine methyltransferase
LRQELEQEFFAADITKDDSLLKNPVDSILRGMNGERTILSLPLDIRGTAFQMRVWSELRRIPYGETRTYAEVAKEIGNPNSTRAVARACATNPIAVVTPCHRVIRLGWQTRWLSMGNRAKEGITRQGERKMKFKIVPLSKDYVARLRTEGQRRASE